MTQKQDLFNSMTGEEEDEDKGRGGRGKRGRGGGIKSVSVGYNPAAFFPPFAAKGRRWPMA